MIRPVLLLLLGACGSQSAESHEHADLSHRVRWAVAQAPHRITVTTLPAEVVAPPGSAARIAPPGTGRLDAWAVSPGQQVAAGDTLAWLISPGLATLEAELAAATATVSAAEMAAETAERAAERGVRSRADAEMARAALDQARATRTALSRQLAARRDTTTRDGDRWAWRSPLAGVVHDMHCEVGDLPEQGGCLSIVRPDDTWIRVAVPERYGVLLGGSDIAGALTIADGRSWTLTRVATAPAIDRHTRSRDLWFVPSEPAPIGASGRASLTIPAPADATTVPEDALTRIDGVPTVMRRVGEGYDAEPVSVTVLGRDPGHVHLSGLTPGDEVAERGVFLLKSLALFDEDAMGGHH